MKIRINDPYRRVPGKINVEEGEGSEWRQGKLKFSDTQKPPGLE
jgi:hypothetical protein